MSKMKKKRTVLISFCTVFMIACAMFAASFYDPVVNVMTNAAEITVEPPYGRTDCFYWISEIGHNLEGALFYIEDGYVDSISVSVEGDGEDVFLSGVIERDGEIWSEGSLYVATLTDPVTFEDYQELDGVKTYEYATAEQDPAAVKAIHFNFDNVESPRIIEMTVSSFAHLSSNVKLTVIIGGRTFEFSLENPNGVEVTTPPETTTTTTETTTTTTTTTVTTIETAEPITTTTITTNTPEPITTTTTTTSTTEEPTTTSTTTTEVTTSASESTASTTEEDTTTFTSETSAFETSEETTAMTDEESTTATVSTTPEETTTTTTEESTAATTDTTAIGLTTTAVEESTTIIESTTTSSATTSSAASTTTARTTTKASSGGNSGNNNTNSSGKVDAPKTGDNSRINILFIVLAVSTLGLGVCVYPKKKVQRKR